jgi:23S rRNA U2552 (ribose-2'-O)-methylase RlmE/FtsJ
MSLGILKMLLPDRAVPVRIWRGPFRGARIVMNPRQSLRKIFGVYEHELNPWLERTLRQVNRVVDVGANDGYFSFGCAAAFHRLGKTGEIIGIESQDVCIAELQESISAQFLPEVTYQLVHAYAGREDKPGWVTLDSLQCATGTPDDRTHTLVKIDVEGAEVDVIEGGRSWITPSNRFVVEVHEERFLAELKAIFADCGHPLKQLNQSPLPLLGRESRKETNWWLVSDV